MKNKKASRFDTWCLFSIVALHKPAGYDQLFLRPALFSSRSDTISIKGNAQPESIPFCISLPAFWVIFPTIAGPGNFVVDAYPVSVHAWDIVIVFVTVLVVGFLSVWYPVRYLSRRLLGR